jgi:hypothetical protein
MRWGTVLNKNLMAVRFKSPGHTYSGAEDIEVGDGCMMDPVFANAAVALALVERNGGDLETVARMPPNIMPLPLDPCADTYRNHSEPEAHSRGWVLRLCERC